MIIKIDVQGIKSSENGFTPLHHACFANQPEIVEYLIEKKVNLNEQDFEGMTALDYACTLDTINLLTKNGAIHGSCFKALKNAIINSNNETVEYLLDNNPALINDKDEEGKSVLHIAAQNSKLDILKYLLEKGAGIY